MRRWILSCSRSKIQLGEEIDEDFSNGRGHCRGDSGGRRCATRHVELGRFQSGKRSAEAGNGFQCEEGETYVMNVMVSAHPYWVPVYQGFKQAAEAMGCETAFSGTPDYDITKQIASFEQDLVESPAGILLHPMQSDPFIEPINAAIDGGVEVVTFAADSPESNRTSYVTSDNVAEAAFAAEEIVKVRSVRKASTPYSRTPARATMTCG